MARFVCPDCGCEKEVADEYAGRSAKCPKCNSSSVIQAKRISPPELPATSVPNHLPGAVRIVLVFTWGSLALGTMLGLLLFLTILSSSTGAVQEAAAGAIFAALFIAGYILARCVEKILGALMRR